jgi:uncharacterized peroxidase-related enzyme
VVHHGAGLRAITKDDALVAELAATQTSASLTDAERAMLAYAAKLTRTPGAMEPSDAEALRAHGFGDREIHDICLVAGYFAFVNRIADGLGVELEE